MIKAIKQKLNNAWLWLKRKVKKVLVVLGVVGTAMAAGGSLTTTPPDISIDKLPQKYNSSQIKQEYQLIDGAKLKKVIKDDWEDRIMVEVGKKKKIFQQGVFGGKSLEVFTPSLKMTRWDEVNFELDPEPIIGSIPLKNRKLNFIGKKIKYTTPKKELHFYNIEPNEKLKEGGYEFEVVLKEKPSTNKLEFTIKTKGLKFYYQPPMTEEKLEEGQTADETHIYDKDGNVIAERPENVVGSYAVYHESKAGAYSKMGGKNYRAGKAFHIYRPRITDANGNWTWGKLNIDEKKGILTIEIDQNFLDKAVYPVKVDPTFGYDTMGSSSTGQVIANEENDRSTMRGMGNQSLSEDGTLESITVALVAKDYNENVDIFLAIYDEDSGGSGVHDLVASVEELDVAITTTSEWKTINADSESLSADTYILAALGNGEDVSNTDNYIYVCADSGGGWNFYFESSTGSGGYETRKSENPWTEDADTTFTYKFSIYCTYTAGGGGAPPPEMEVIIIE